MLASKSVNANVELGLTQALVTVDWEVMEPAIAILITLGILMDN